MLVRLVMITSDMYNDKKILKRRTQAMNTTSKMIRRSASTNTSRITEYTQTGELQGNGMWRFEPLTDDGKLETTYVSKHLLTVTETG